MFRRILVTALFAGLAGGIVNTAAQQAWVQPLILQAETFEDAASQKEGTANGGGEDPARAAAAEEPAAEAPANGVDFERTSLTLLANVLTGIGFALLLGAAITLAGREIEWRRGLAWGLAGFAAFGIAPALGLPPEPPGVEAADLGQRQFWWLGTVAATALGLWLLILAKHRALKALGVLVLVIPHAVGAPQLDAHGGVTPQAIIDEFIVASLVTSAAFWLVLGGMSGLLARRLS
jgi:cobalt transporter subunit CbtA